MHIECVQLDLPPGGISALQSLAAELASTVHVSGRPSGSPGTTTK